MAKFCLNSLVIPDKKLFAKPVTMVQSQYCGGSPMHVLYMQNILMSLDCKSILISNLHDANLQCISSWAF